MHWINLQQKWLKCGITVARCVAILSLTGLFSILVTSFGAAADGTVYTVTLTQAPSETIAEGRDAFITVSVAPNPGAGQTVHFQIHGANNIGGVDAQTDSSGEATIHYSMFAGRYGQDTVSATFAVTPPDSSNTASVSFSWVGLDLTPSEQTSPTGEPTYIHATLHYPGGTIDNVPIHFSVSGSNSIASDIRNTEPDGTASFGYAGTNAGTDTISAWADLNGNTSQQLDSEPTAAQVSVTFATYSIDLSPAVQDVSVGTTTALTATVTDQNDDPAEGVQVHFAVSGDHSDSGVDSTDSNGKVTFSYSEAMPGRDVVRAFIDIHDFGKTTDAYDLGEPTDTSTVNWNTFTLVLTPSTQNRTVGTTAYFNASLSNSNGGVTGIPIRYSVSGPNATGGTAYTNFGGTAAFSYVGNVNSTDTVTAYADLNNNGVRNSNEPADTAIVIWGTGSIGSYTLTLTPATQTVASGADASLTATFNNPFGGETGVIIRYAISGANSDSGALLTDGSGQVTIVDSGNNSGTDTINAYADLNNNGVQNVGEPGASATVVRNGANLSLAPAAQIVAAGSQVSITATYTAASGSANGATIRYTTTGANPGSGSLTTDSNGHATISYTGVTPGSDTVNAYVDLNHNSTQDSGEPSATATVGLNGNAVLTLSPALQNATLGASASVTATLTSNNTAVSGVTIRYDITGANSRAGNVQTNSSGNAIISYSGTLAGVDYLWAFADFDNSGTLSYGEPASTVTISWSSGGSVTPPPSSNELPAAQPATPKAGCTYFAATQHNLCTGFQQYWNTFGGLAIFGMPITEEFQENGVTVQYFERERFEWHPGSDPAHFDVLLGLLGNEVTAGRQTKTPFMTAVPKAGDCTYYAQTGHNLCAGFKAYWEKYGGLAVYGYPISEEFQEVNPDTGQTYTVQYFERGRYEWHPGEWPERFDVELGRLGAQVFSMKYGTQYH